MKYFRIKTGKFETVTRPEGWKLISDPRGHLDEICNCASCGKEVTVRDTIMSKKYLEDGANKFGQEPGFALCWECGMKEAKGLDEEEENV